MKSNPLLSCVPQTQGTRREEGGGRGCRWLWPTLANPIVANPCLASPFGRSIFGQSFLCCVVVGVVVGVVSLDPPLDHPSPDPLTVPIAPDPPLRRTARSFTRQPQNSKRAHLRVRNGKKSVVAERNGSWCLKHHQNFVRRLPERETERADMEAGEGEKKA